MAKRTIRLRPLAADEADVARLWYFERNPDVAQAFVAALDAAVVITAHELKGKAALVYRRRRRGK